MSLHNRPTAEQQKSAALAYAKRGWHVLPVHSRKDGGSCTCNKANCVSIAKHPITAHGVKDASADESTIVDWWKQAPIANVGIATGKESGIFVVDLDGPEGIDAFRKLGEEHGEPPATYTVQTPGGGKHVYFQYPDDRTIGNRTKINGQPIDVRGDGGYVLAPPSLHASGRQYANDEELPIAQAPDWLLDLIDSVIGPSVVPVVRPAPADSPSGPMSFVVSAGGGDLASRVRAYLAKCPPAISGQGGHAATYAVAKALVQGFGLSADEAMPYLAEWNERCEPPWSAKELTHKIKDAESKGQPPAGKSRGYLLNESANTGPSIAIPSPSRPKLIPIDPWKPFPIEALPKVVRDLVEQGAAAIGCDPAYIAVVVLPILAGLIGNTRRIRLKRHWLEPPTIWSALVADSGSMKSPALDLVANPLRELQTALMDRHRDEMETFREEQAIWERDFAEWKKGKAQTRPPAEPLPPVCERVLVSDTTVEKLAVLLGENPRGLGVLRDELAGWFGSMNAYKSKGGADVPFWLEAHRAGQAMIDRKAGGTTCIKRANVSLTGTIQPAILARALTAEYRESGLAARILIAMPPKGQKRWSERDVEDRVTDTYADLLANLRALEWRTLQNGDVEPWVLDLNEDAKRIWVTYYNRWAEAQADAQGDLAAAFAKIEGYAARFALIHHVVEHASAGTSDLVPIGPESVEAGIMLADWFAYEAQRVYAILGESDAERDLRRLIDLIDRKGSTITPRELQRSNNRRYRNVEAAQADLVKLVDAGLGTLTTTAPASGGHATLEFTLDPARRMTLAPTHPPERGSSPHDTRVGDLSSHSENGSSVVPVMRRAVVDEEIDGNDAESLPGSTVMPTETDDDEREVSYL